LIRIFKLHYLRHLGYIFVIRHDVRNLLNGPEISPKSDIRLRHPTFPLYPTFKTLIILQRSVYIVGWVNSWLET